MAAAAAAAQPTDPEILTELTKLLDEIVPLKKSLNEHLAKGDQIPSAVLERIDKLESRTTELFDGQKALREKASRPPGSGGPQNGLAEFRSIGTQFVEHDNFKASLSAPSQRPRVQATIKGRLLPQYEMRAINPFISSDPTTGWVFFPKRIGVFTQPVTPLITRDLVDVVPIDATNSIEYVLETWTLAADYQLKEGDKKAQSDVTYTDKTAVVRTIAHFVKISRQMMADAPYIRASIDNRMIYGIALKEDKEILYGDGTAGHLLGIMPQATAFNAAALVVDNPIDQMYAAIMQALMTGHAPTALVLNPMTWAGLALSKNSMGLYVLGGPPATEANPRLWGLPVALTMNMLATEFLVGAFPGNAALFDREQANVEMALENEDDFIRNLVTIRAEERIALAVFVPAAFIKGTVMVVPPTGGVLSGGAARGGK